MHSGLRGELDKLAENERSVTDGGFALSGKGNTFFCTEIKRFKLRVTLNN